ncbi:MAG: hypothetical protein OEQ47_16230, partial [Acidimicrobiia bacterium]|nr:hypothetical protein [Acidimicrobiia bacterium]
QWWRLLGVELIDGSPSVIYVRMDDRGDFDNARDTLRIYDFETAEVAEVRTVGGWEGGVGHVTYGGGVFASNWFGEAYYGFDFFDARGTDVFLGGDPYPSGAVCFDGTIDPGGGRCYENLAISPDGSTIVYTIVVPDDEGIIRKLDLVVVGATDGSQLHRFTLRTDEPFSIDSLEIRGDSVLYNGYTFTTRRERVPATVVDLTTGQSSTIPVPGTARFASMFSGG